MSGLDADIITLAWLIVGLLLIGGEVFIPGLVAVFLGMGALLVAGLRYIGLIDGMVASLFVWMGASVGFTYTLRNTLRKFLPAETERGQIDEGIAALGEIVEVLTDVNEQDASGRIRYQGTTWPATSTDQVIPKGARARLVARDNLAWIVEPVLEIEGGERDGEKSWE